MAGLWVCMCVSECVWMHVCVYDKQQEKATHQHIPLFFLVIVQNQRDIFKPNLNAQRCSYHSFVCDCVCLCSPPAVINSKILTVTVRPEPQPSEPMVVVELSPLINVSLFSHFPQLLEPHCFYVFSCNTKYWS